MKRPWPLDELPEPDLQPSDLPPRKREPPAWLNWEQYHAFKILVPQVMSGAIVGEKGSVIAGIRNETGAMLSLTEHGVCFPSTDFQVLSLQAEKPEALVAAVILVHEALMQSSHFATLLTNAQGDHILNFLCPKEAVSKLLGHKGVTIQGIRETCQVQIKVDENQVGFGPAAEQMVRVTGSKQSVQAAAEQVVVIMQQENGCDWFMQWGRRTHGYEMGWDSSPNVGKSSGKGKSKDKGFDQNYSGGKGVREYSGSVAAAASRLRDLLPDLYNTQPPATPAQDFLPPEGPYFAFKWLIPKELTGSVVGQRGSVIEAIRQECGASLQLTEPDVFFPRTTSQVLSVQAESFEALIAALKCTYQRIKESEKLMVSSMVAPNDGGITFSLVCPKETVSKILGSKGANIAQMRQATGAQIKILEDQVGKGPAAEQIVKITGSEDSVEAATEMVINFVQQVNQEPWFFQWGRRTKLRDMGWDSAPHFGSKGGSWDSAPHFGSKGGSGKGVFAEYRASGWTPPLAGGPSGYPTNIKPKGSIGDRQQKGSGKGHTLARLPGMVGDRDAYVPSII